MMLPSHTVWTVTSLCFLLLATHPLGAQSAGATAEITRLQMHRIHPHVERAERLERIGEHRLAAASWEEALHHAPDHTPLMIGVVRSLSAAGAYREALERSKRLPEAQARPLRDALYLRLAETETLDPGELSSWLTMTTLPRPLLFRATNRVAETSGGSAALKWLEAVDCEPAGVCGAVIEIRFTLLEERGEATARELAEALRATRPAHLQPLPEPSAVPPPTLPCLQQVTMTRLAGLDQQARYQFSDCDAHEDPEHWLWTAAELGQWEQIAAMHFDTRADENLRRDILIEHYLIQGDDRALVELVPIDDPDTTRLERRAVALEHLGYLERAAEQWLIIHQRTGDPAVLNQATYLLVLASRDERALNVLYDAAPFEDEGPGTELINRLIALQTASANPPDPERLVGILTTTGRPRVHLSVGRILARHGLCDTLSRNEPDSLDDLLLGICLLETRPELAVHHLEQAHEAGLEEATRPLAWALVANHEYGAALAVWQSLEPTGLTETERQTLVQVALDAGEVDVARDHWQRWGDETDPVWLRLGAIIATRSDETDTARRRWSRLYAQQPSAGVAIQLATLERSIGDTAAAEAWLRRDLERAPGNRDLWLQLGYLLAVEQPDAAITALTQAELIEAPLPYAATLQLGYLHAAHGSRAEARNYLRQGIDAMDPESPPPHVTTEDLEEQRHAARRTHERMDRNWDFGLNTWLASGSVPGELLFPEQAPRNHAEVWASRRLGGDTEPRFGPLSVFGRLVAEGPSDDPLSSRAVVAGLLWQPFPGNLALSAQWVEPRDGDGELVLTAATQQLDRGRWRADWRATEERWWERRLYGEVAWWTRTDDYQVFARYDHRHHWRWSDAPGSWFAYGLGEARARDTGEDVRVGLGIGARMYTGESHYNAWRQRHVLRLEVHRTVVTDLADESGVFLRFSTQW